MAVLPEGFVEESEIPEGFLADEDVARIGVQLPQQITGEIGRLMRAGAMATPDISPPRTTPKTLSEMGLAPAGVSPVALPAEGVTAAIEAPIRLAGTVAGGLGRSLRDVLTPTTFLPEQEQQRLRPFVISREGELRPQTPAEMQARDVFQPGRPLLPIRTTQLQPEGSDAARILSSLTTPESIVMLGAGGASKLAGAVFLGSMAPGILQDVERVASSEASPEEKRDRINSLVLPVILAVRGAKPRVSPGAPDYTQEMRPLELTGAELYGRPRGATPVIPTAGPEVLGPVLPRRVRTPGVVVPETAPEARVTAVEEVRAKQADTIPKILELFPSLERNRAKAREIGKAAWGEQWPEQPVPKPKAIEEAPPPPEEPPPPAPPAAPVAPPPPPPAAAPTAAAEPPPPAPTAPAPEVPPVAPEVAATAPEVKPATIEDTIIAGQTLATWEAVRTAGELPRGEPRAELARWLAVPNQPSRILQALGNKKRTREIHAPPAPIETVKPVEPTPAPEVTPPPAPGAPAPEPPGFQPEPPAPAPEAAAPAPAVEPEAAPDKPAPPKFTQEQLEAQSQELDRLIADKRRIEADQTKLIAMRDAAEEGSKKRSELSEQVVKTFNDLRPIDKRISQIQGTVFDYRWAKETAPFRGVPQPAPSKPTITAKVLKAQRENLLGQVDQAIKQAPDQAPETDKILLSVPGDGDFNIINSKEKLKEFRDIVKKYFPADVSKGGAPGLPSGKPKAMPKAVPPTDAELPAIGVSAVSTDESRAPLLTGYADGTQIISTDGRQMLRIVTDKAPGTPAAPVRLDEKGNVTEGIGNYPNYNQILSPSPDLMKGGADSGQLWQLANQALVIWKGVEEKEAQSAKLYINPDGSLGLSSRRGTTGDEYSSNIQEGAKWAGDYNPQYLRNAADVARRLGNDKVDLYAYGSEGPLEVRGKNHQYVVMPMRLGEGNAPMRDDLSRFTPGQRAHGSMPTGYGPLRNPESFLQEAITSGGTRYAVNLEAGQFRVEQNFPKTGQFGSERWDEIARFSIDATRKPIIEALTSEGKAPSKDLVSRIENAVRNLKRERQGIIDEGIERTKGEAPSMGPGAAAAAEFTARENRRRLLSDITEQLFGTRAGEVVDALLRKLAGEVVPKTMALSGEAGNKMVRFAAATTAAPHIARSYALEVLGDRFTDLDFRERLGAVLVEDRLRAIRKGIEDAAEREIDPTKKQRLLNQAADVNTLVGTDKYFPDEAAFTGALRDPEIAQAIKNHKETIQPEAERYHTEAEGQLAGPGVNTGAFINLLPIFEESPGAVFSSTRKGDYTRPFKKKSVFSRRAKGTAEKYELDYLPLAERMIRGNYEEYTKRQLYDQLQADHLAVVLAPNAPRPTFDGRPAEKFQIKRQTLVTAAGGETRVIPQYENLWVRPDIAPELRQAEHLGNPVSNIALARFANVLNRIQLAGPTDAVWHIANMMSTIAGSQGGQTFLTDLGRKIPLVNVIDATVRVTSAAKRVLANDPDIMRQIAELSEIGAVRPDRPGGMFTSRLINLIDKAGRSVRDDMYRNLAQRGLIEPSEVGRREFVNQLGQYNPRIMGQLESFFKEAGLSPFIVAGRNFNRMALRRMVLSPGIKAANVQSAIQMRAVEATGVIATLVAVPAVLNALTVHSPVGRPGVPFGSIDTGKDDKNGKHIYIDPAQWIGLRRGMRLTGVNALVEGMRRSQPAREMERQAIHDIIGAAVHPWAGPAVQMPVIGATGYTTSFFRESRDPGDYWQNFLAALRNINPIVHGYFQKQGKGVIGGLESSMTSLASAAGVKTKTPLSAVSQVHELANNWASKSDNPKIRSNYEQHAKESFSSQYGELRGALARGDTSGAREAYKDLRKNGKTPSDIQRTIEHPHPFAGSAALEYRFRRSLTPEQQDLYKKALEERKQLVRRFHQMLSTKE